jgi:hypothetical protein
VQATKKYKKLVKHRISERVIGEQVKAVKMAESLPKKRVAVIGAGERPFPTRTLRVARNTTLNQVSLVNNRQDLAAWPQ